MQKNEYSENISIIEPAHKELPSIIDKNNQYSADIFEIEPLPDINLNDLELNKDKNEYIPVNIRLSDTAKPKKEINNGTISSISKLLVNQRDIENIIQVNELMQNIGCDTAGTHIISMRTGSKIYAQLNKIMVDYKDEINSLILLNKAGFILASTLPDKQKEQNIGAIAVVAFLVLQNYLNKINIYPTKIFFETDEVFNVIFEINDKIQFFNCAKEFNPIDFVNEIFHQNDFVYEIVDQKLENIKDLHNAVIADKNSKVIEFINCEDPDSLASLACAIFENLKVFVMNIQPAKLNRITVFSNDKILLINKDNDNIGVFCFENNGQIKLSEQIIEIESILKQGIE